MQNIVFSATGVVMSALERMVNASIHVEGLDNLTDHPTLFVVNHFTRMETFLLPYIIHKHNGMIVRSLAHSSLFHGFVGRYLNSVGTLSSASPLRNRQIVQGLLTGESNWVIYPEGVMMKNKDVVEKGRFLLNVPSGHSAPHTGAALLALKAETIRDDILRSKGSDELLRCRLKRYGVEDAARVSTLNTVVTPVNISYYPLRPGRNLLSDLAMSMIKDLPDKLAEELTTESAILFSDCDITFYFGPPINIGDEIKPVLDLYARIPERLQLISKESLVVGLKKKKLTAEFMRQIYTKVAINIDNLFCAALRIVRGKCIREDDFRKALYLSAVEIRLLENRRTHDTLREDFLKIITKESYAPYEDIRELAVQEGVITIRDGYLLISKELLDKRDYYFHDIRLKYTAVVLANELAPLGKVVAALRRNVNQSGARLRFRIAELLAESDQRRFEKDYTSYYDPTLSKPRSVGRPFFLRASDRSAGVVLSHGYLSAPQEMRPLAEWLFSRGYSVYCPRLKGMGTAPRQMKDVTWDDWLQSYDRAFAIVRHYCQDVILGGFSMGGLLALYCAARNAAAVKGLFCINTPIMLVNPKTRLVPACMMWNRLLEQFRLSQGTVEYVKNQAENPAINYSRNYLKGLYELKGLMKATRDSLPEITAPTLIIQGNHDPAVDSQSAQIIHAEVSSSHKRLIDMDFDRHVIVRDDGSERVFRVIADFIGQIRQSPGCWSK